MNEQLVEIEVSLTWLLVSTSSSMSMILTLCLYRLISYMSGLDAASEDSIELITTWNLDTQ